jgi:hypothetical protein
MSTTAELLTTFNEMRTAIGSKPLKAWKESRAKLEAAIAAWPASPVAAKDFELSEAELAAQADRAKVQAAKAPKVEEEVPLPAPKLKFRKGTAKGDGDKRVTKDVKFLDGRETKKGDVWLTELCETYKLNPKVARAKMRRLYSGDTKGLPTLLGRWSWASTDTAAIVKLLKK